jgi:hypothetical protein
LAANLSAYKLAASELSSSTKFDNLVQALQDALNGIGDTTKMAFAAGAIFDPTKLKQAGATSGQVLIWGGTAWAPAAAPSSAYTLIADSTLGADGTFSFTSIPNTYEHLQLVCYLRSDRAATEDDLGLRFNNDTASNYDGYTFRGNGTGPTSTGGESLAATSLVQKNSLVGNTATANVFGGVTVTIPHYAGTTNNKAAHSLAGKKIGTATGNLSVLMGMGAWRSNSAINRVDLLPAGGGTNFKAGSRVSLYGL